ncbi:MAG: type ISP restriction/modification enzyme [Armatimonadota bacterium]|jgi:hypothetical protein
MPHPVEDYLKNLRTIHGTGAATDETSYYEPLAALLNTLGEDLDPEVRCVMQPASTGAGIPDGGLFTREQVQSGDPSEILTGGRPARGVIEVKGAGEAIDPIVEGPQVARYFDRYRQVLVTNYREFVFLGQDVGGEREEFGRFSFADSEAEFRALTQAPRKAADEHGQRFVDFIQRFMTHAAPLCDPEDVAWLLASYAREAMARVEEAQIPALASLREALEDALGLTFEGEEGEHFFRSTLVQTLFYGIFSAWVIWSREREPTSEDRFDWRAAEWTLHVPMIAALYQQIASPGKLRSLGVVEVLEWTADALNRVDRASFFDQFDEGQAVQYFYEPFLQAFDPDLRKQLGVWYTPTEIVRYMVERVDRVLREELEIADGLADPNVYVLDPCCGTGAYLVEVLRRIERTKRENDPHALVADDVKQAAKKRVFGFEIMPAPFVVAHLQIGLFLRNLGAPLSDELDEDGKPDRVEVYLTNALTRWDPSDAEEPRLPIEEFQEEMEAADDVKRSKPVLVVIGNPPYNGFAGMAMGEERNLVEAYRQTKRAPKPEGQGLNDLYVRFFRIAERQIVESMGRGIVCFISNYSWLDARSFTGMREHYYDTFNTVWIDNLHGDRIISEVAPDGRPSQTVFRIRGQSVGIKVGTAIATLMASDDSTAPHKAQVLYRDFDQSQAHPRREALLSASGGADAGPEYAILEPDVELGYPFKPRTVAEGYYEWPLLPYLFPGSYPGVKTSRDSFVVEVDEAPLRERVTAYFDASTPDDEIGSRWPAAMNTTNRFDAPATREALVERGLLEDNFVRYLYRPLDRRWLYWEPEGKLLDEKRPDYFPHVFPGNLWLSAEERNRKAFFYQPQFTTVLADHHIVESNAQMFPLYLRNGDENNGGLFGEDEVAVVPNLTDRAKSYLTRLDAEPATLFFHALGALHAPMYADENAGALRQDWPRVPLPDERGLLEASAELGREVAALLDTESGVAGVTEGDIRPELRPMGTLSSVDGEQLQPDEGDLAVTAGWGYLGYRDATMPGQGRLVERDYTHEELAAIEQGAEALGLTLDEALAQCGRATCDVFLNERAYWRNVPEGVWNYYIGGYQVIKKWLSYREQKVLGRDLRPEEARYVTEMVRRIAAILLLQPRLDENYQRVKESAFDWSALAATGPP